MLFKIDEKRILKIDNNALIKMYSYKQTELSTNESGGILIGRIIQDTDNVIVDEVSEPSLKDKSSRFRFFRSAELHQKVIDLYWYASGGTMNYIGEWHTHPESNPNPSNIDLKSWRKKLLERGFDNDALYFIIVGTQTLNVWQGEKNTLNITKLIQIDE